MLQKVVLPEPSTYYAGAERYAGVRALWIKVIIRAVFDWVSYRDSDKLMQRKLAESASSWLFQPSTLFNGFENVCGYLDICPDHVRMWAKAMSREQVAKIEHLERFPNGRVDEAIVSGFFARVR